MIRLTDAYILALTKLKTRKIRTTITIIISALLFGILIASIIIVQGSYKSIESFSEEGLNNRYLTAAFNGSSFEEGLFSRKDLINRANEIHEEIILEKEALSKQLGITYDSTNEQLPYSSYDGDPKNNHLSFRHPAAEQTLKEYYATKPAIGLPQLQSAAEGYNPTAFYKGSNLQPLDGTMSWMEKGKETFPDAKKEQSQYNQDEDKLFSFGTALMPLELTSPFILKQNSWTPASPNIPILVSYANAQRLLDLPSLAKNATETDHLDRIFAVQSQIADVVVSACYRNTASQEQINKAVYVPNEIVKNSNTESYNPPNLQYNLPAKDSCEGASVKVDTRSNNQKNLDEKQSQFDQKFGTASEPKERKINFQVIGVFPDPPNGEASNTIDDLVTSLVGSSSVMSQTTIPEQLYRQMPTNSQHTDVLGKADPGFFAPDSDLIYFVEFSNADDARKFINEKSCTNSSAGSCLPKENHFSLMAIGSNSIALADLKNKVNNVLQIAFIIIAIIAMIIMSGTIGRMIADGRRETAVFRAIGFRRIDIANIYIAYTLLLSILVTLSALIIGITAAYIIDQTYSQNLTVKAKLAFGATDPTREFHLFSLDSPLIWLVAIAIILLGFISMLLPLIRNVRRNPIKDMRDDS